MRERRAGPYSKRGKEMGTKPRHRAQERSAYTDVFLGGGPPSRRIPAWCCALSERAEIRKSLGRGGWEGRFEEVKA